MGNEVWVTGLPHSGTTAIIQMIEACGFMFRIRKCKSVTKVILEV